MKRKIRVNEELIDTKTFTSTRVAEFGQGDKCYAIVAKCGHCGKGRFIPILFTLRARDREAAVEVIRNYPRVKNANPQFVLFMQEIDMAEYMLIRNLNKQDGYLNSGACENSKFKHRTIIEEYYMNCDNKKLLEDEIKEANEYTDESLVLQRYFAPTYINGELVYPRKVLNKGIYMLKEYYTFFVRKYGFDTNVEGRWQMLGLYYEIFGPNNELGIKVEGDCLMYKHNDKFYSSLIPKNRRSYFSDLKPTRFMQLSDKKVEDVFEEPYSPKENSQIAKFNARWNRPMSR